MSFFRKLKDRMFKSSSRFEAGLDALVSDNAEEAGADAPRRATDHPDHPEPRGSDGGVDRGDGPDGTPAARPAPAIPAAGTPGPDADREHGAEPAPPRPAERAFWAG